MRLRTPLLLFVTFILAASFSYYAASDCLHYRDVCFGTATVNEPIPAPYRYRILEPFLTRLANPSGTQEGAVLAAIALYTLLTSITIPALYLWLRRFTSDDRAMIGVMVYALTTVAAFHLWYISLGTTIEVCLVMLALCLLGLAKGEVIHGQHTA